MSGFLSSSTSALGNLLGKLWWKLPNETESETVPVPELEPEPEPENEFEASEYGTANKRSDEKDDSEDESEDGLKDLDIKVPWPVLFPDNENYRKVWQRGIKKAKDMLRVNGAEYF